MISIVLRPHRRLWWCGQWARWCRRPRHRRRRRIQWHGRSGAVIVPLSLSSLVARARWCHRCPVVIIIAARVVSPSSTWRASHHIVVGVVIAHVASSSSSSSSLSPLRDGTTGRGDSMRRHEEWVAQIERAAQVRIGRADKLGRHVSVNRLVGVLT